MSIKLNLRIERINQIDDYINILLYQNEQNVYFLPYFYTIYSNKKLQITPDQLNKYNEKYDKNIQMGEIQELLADLKKRYHNSIERFN